MLTVICQDCEGDPVYADGSICPACGGECVFEVEGPSPRYNGSCDTRHLPYVTDFGSKYTHMTHPGPGSKPADQLPGSLGAIYAEYLRRSMYESEFATTVRVLNALYPS